MTNRIDKKSEYEKSVKETFSFFKGNEKIAEHVGITPEVFALENASEKKVLNMTHSDKERLNLPLRIIGSCAEKIMSIGIEKFSALNNEQKVLVLEDTIRQILDHERISQRNSPDTVGYAIHL